MTAQESINNLVTDYHYINTQCSKRQRDFIRNKNTHVDFLIQDDRVHKPILVIELDGKYHRENTQKERDEFKNEALAHMDIPLLRIDSKTAFTHKDLKEWIKQILQQKNIPMNPLFTPSRLRKELMSMKLNKLKHKYGENNVNSIKNKIKFDKEAEIQSLLQKIKDITDQLF